MRLIILGLALGLQVISYASAEEIKDNNHVIAVVNNQEISSLDVEMIIKDLKRTGTVIDKKARETLIERLIEQKMVAQYAKKFGYEKREDVQKKTQVMAEMVLRDSYLSDIVRKEVTKEAVKEAFDKQMDSFSPQFEYKASHILVDNFQDAQMIKLKIDKGQKFSDMAQKYSTDKSTGTGGDLGFFSEEMMVKPFSQATSSLSIGEVSEPIQTDFGWHIIKLIEKRLLPKPTFAQLQSSIQTKLSREAIAKHIEKIKEKSEIIFNKDSFVK